MQELDRARRILAKHSLAPGPPELRANPRLIEAAVQNETLSILSDWATFWLIYDQPATRAPGPQVTKIAGVGGAVRDIAAMPKM